MKVRLRFVVSSLIAIVLMLFTPSGSNGQSVATVQFSSQEQGLGAEYQLSNPTNPETDRYKPASAYNTANHQTMVVWHRNGGGSYFIEGRLISATGRPLGSSPTIFVSGGTPVYQPAVAYNATDNQYIVVWMRNTNLDGKSYAIWGKILSANLVEVKPEFKIFSPPTNFSCWSPRVAWNQFPTRDEYMVVFNDYDISSYPSMTPNDITQETIYSDGSPIGHILVIGNSPGNLIYPREVDLVFANTDNFGKYMWVWHQNNPITHNSEIWGANIDANLGGYLSTLPPFRIDNTTSEKANPHIATNGANDFMVVWQERSPVSPNDWDIHGREMNQIGTFIGYVHVIAGEGSTDETNPFIAAWPGSTPNYIVGYERQSATGQDIWLAYYNNGANTLSYSNFTFWLDYFPAAAYGFWTNSTPTGVINGPNLQFAYQGVSNLPGDHPHIYLRMWTPFLIYLPVVMR
jgi:hypothetical protein